jgi:hypothetical protein
MQTTIPNPTQSLATTVPSAATRWLKLAVVYLLLGISMGIVMGATENFTLRPVHAHVGLLGWASLGLAGLIYSVFPTAATSRLGRIHFWLHNLGLPLMMAALAALLLGFVGAIPFLVAAECMLAAGFIAFALNVFRNLDRRT